MTRPAPEEILAALDPEQREAAEALDGPVVVLAGAGTGKTRAITHRIAYGVATASHDPRRTLAVTFTARAAGEMRGRLAALGVEGVQARTFHSAALRQVRYFWPQVVGGEPPEVLPSKSRLVGEAARQVGVSREPALVRDVAAEIEWAKVTQVTADSYPEAFAAAGRGAVGALEPRAVAKVFAAYEDLRTDRHLMDFEDVLMFAAVFIEDRPDVADRVRAQYRWFTVDEYQDVNPLQQRLLDSWLGESNDQVCVVGDAAQTIYTFAGASPSYLLGFSQRYPDATEVRLVRSYRCSPQIVTLANRVLAGARGPSATLTLTLRSEQPDGPEPVVEAFPDEPAEAASVARSVAAALAQGTRARDVAVLVRINAQTEPFEEAFADAGVPYDVRGAERFFHRPEVRQAVTLLRGAARGAAAGVGDRGESLTAQVRGVLGGMGWSPDASTAGTGATAERWANLARLATLASDLETAHPGATLDDLVADLAARSEHAQAPVAESVTLASLHAAKGLEWPVVFLAGLVDGTLPILHADTPARVEEERRLLYVGVTRAARQLTLSWALARTPGQRHRDRSRFLDDLGPAVNVVGEHGGVVRRGKGGRAERRRRGPATCRVCGKALVTGVERALGRCATCPSTYDEALLDRLTAWRREESRSRSVPAFVVATDATLQALAELAAASDEPPGRADLVGVVGLGPRKLADFGGALEALLAGRHPFEPGPEPDDVAADAARLALVPDPDVPDPDETRGGRDLPAVDEPGDGPHGTPEHPSS